jgi:hypothetical protein
MNRGLRMILIHYVIKGRRHMGAAVRFLSPPEVTIIELMQLLEIHESPH